MVPDLDFFSKCESGSHAATRSSKKNSEWGSGFTEHDSMLILMKTKVPDWDKLKGGQRSLWIRISIDPHNFGNLDIRIRIKVISRIRSRIQIRINLKMTSLKVWNMSLFKHLFKGLRLYLEAWIWIRIWIRLKSRLGIRIRVKNRTWIRIRIRVKSRIWIWTRTRIK